MSAAIIFDLDGVLIDSEPAWQKAQQEIFDTLGITVTPEDAKAMTGLRVADHVDAWHARHPWQHPPKSHVVAQIVDRAMSLLRANGAAMPGAVGTVRALAAEHWKLAIASSSHLAVIQEVVKTLDLESCFDVVHSAEREPHGKPHPGVYLSTAARLQVGPAECVAIEDSLNGVRAAKAAGMKCVAVPNRASSTPSEFGIADLVLPSLEVLTSGMIEMLLDHEHLRTGSSRTRMDGLPIASPVAN